MMVRSIAALLVIFGLTATIAGAQTPTGQSPTGQTPTGESKEKPNQQVEAGKPGIPIQSDTPAPTTPTPGQPLSPPGQTPPQDPSLAAPFPPPPLQTIESEESPAWTRTLERIATGVVAIQIDAVRAFDTEWNASAQATGFVVDAKRGLILTNRHVVMPGPVTAQATLLNREEVQLYPVYRDPVHDFGFYRYDPEKLRFIKPAEIPLYPEGAQVGREIRVIGNDAGEQLSILAGTLARLDRDAPAYGFGRYNDFNTFYYQAASSTSGGSSGSPVIDIQGRAVALNAGGSSGAASSFYLPLKRVKRALKLIQEGKPVTRATLQTVFQYTPFAEARRLGLRPETEAQMRETFPKLTGVLVVSEVQPGSATAGILEPGDILVRANGKLIADFDALSELLDDRVGGLVDLEAQRGGRVLNVKLEVQDLHSITPAEYLEFGEAVVHPLSYQQARHFNVPVQGIYVANPGYVFGAAGIPRGAVLVSLSGKPVRTLSEFEKLLSEVAEDERVTVRYFTLEDPHNQQWRVARMDRHWFPARKCHRDDKQGLWPCAELAAGPQPVPQMPASTKFPKLGDARMERIAASLVQINFDMPYTVSGVTERNYHGTALVVDAQRGLVVTDRNTVPVAIGDARLVFAGSIEVPAKVVYIHPLHNLAVVSYDPKLLGNTPVRSAKLNPAPLKAGDSVWVTGLRAEQKVASQQTEVASVDAVAFPLSRTMQFRDANLEAISLINPPADYDGVLLNKAGDVMALWSSFAYDDGRELQQVNAGIPAEMVMELLSLVTSGKSLHSLEAEFQQLPLSSARKLGLPQEWIDRLEARDSQRRQVLSVARLVAGSPAADVLQTGDLILAIDGQPANRFREVERAADKARVTVTVWRNDTVMDLPVDTVPLFGHDIDRLVLWAGATLQAAHRPMAAQRGIPAEGVFVGYFYYGSPATRYRLMAGRRITEVDGQPTPDLDAFLKAVANKPDRASVRLKTIAWNNAVEVITLKLDNHYWPAYELKHTPDGWVRTAVE